MKDKTVGTSDFEADNWASSVCDSTTSSTVLMALLVREQHQVLTAVINCLAFYLGLITPSKHHFRPSEQTRRTSLRLVRLSEVASL